MALRLGDGDEHRALESDTTGLDVKGNLYLVQNCRGPLKECENKVKLSPMSLLSKKHSLRCCCFLTDDQEIR